MAGPATRTVEASDLAGQWSDILRGVTRGEGRVAVEDGGVPVAAIVSAEDLERLLRLERGREGSGILREIGERFKDEDPEEIEREVARAVEEARAEAREHGGSAG